LTWSNSSNFSKELLSLKDKKTSYTNISYADIEVIQLLTFASFLERQPGLDFHPEAVLTQLLNAFPLIAMIRRGKIALQLWREFSFSYERMREE